MSIHTVEIALPSVIDTVAVAAPETVAVVEIRQGPAGTGGGTWDSLTGTASQVPFEPVTPPAYAEGLVFYDTDDKSLVYYGDEPDTAMNIGRELWVRVRNDSGAPILNGKVVYINDAIGQLPTIRLARADSAVTSRVIGIATHDIGNNEFGYVTTAGEVKGLNTVAFQDGDLLFLSATNAGEMTTTAPTAPNRVIQVATVLHAHISQGKLYCHPENDSVPSTGIVDSTATGRALITAATAAAARATLTLGSTDSVSFGQLTATATSSNQHTLASSAGTNISGPLTLSGSGSDTLAATYSNTITLTGTTGVTIAGGPLAINSSSASFNTGTITTSQPLALTQTWNNVATTFKALDVNVTDTASNGSSLLMDLRVGGVSKAKIDKAGTVIASVASVGNGSVSATSLNFGVVNSGLFSPNGFELAYSRAGSVMFYMTFERVAVGSTCTYSWSSSSSASGTPDLYLSRDGAASTLAQRNGNGANAAQTFRLYNTYTSSTNFERLNFRWSSNTAFIGTEKGSGSPGGTARDLVLETDGTERVRVLSTGNVGIGTTSPAQKLDVVGSIKASGTVQTGGYTFATLPTPATGMRAYITDGAAAPVYMANAAGGGSTVTPVFYNGTNWINA